MLSVAGPVSRGVAAHCVPSLCTLFLASALSKGAATLRFGNWGVAFVERKLGLPCPVPYKQDESCAMPTVMPMHGL